MEKNSKRKRGKKSRHCMRGMRWFSATKRQCEGFNHNPKTEQLALWKQLKLPKIIKEKREKRVLGGLIW